VHPRQLADTPDCNKTSSLLPRTAYYLLQLMSGLLPIG